MAGISMPSQEELAQRGGDFKLLPEDEYVFELKELVINKDQRNPYNDEVRDTLTAKLRPIKFADGSALVDVDGDEVPDDKLVFDFIDPTKVGMKPQPSKARRFFTGLLGVKVGDGFSIEDYGDLIGKRVIGSVIIKAAQGDKGEQNRVTGYRAIPSRPTRRAAAAEPQDELTEAGISAASEAPAIPGESTKKSRPAAKPAAANIADDEDF